MKHVRRLLCTILALFLVASSARAQVLQAVPSESIIVIKLKNLADVSQKVGMLSEQWGLTQMRPELKDPLTSLLTMANLGAGLNKNGEAAMAILDVGDGRQPPKGVFLVSVTDYKAFAAALPNAKADGELNSFKMGGQGPEIFVANWGTFAAISPDKDLLGKKGAGVQIEGVTKKEMDAKDLIAWVNFKALRPTLLPLIKDGKQQFMQMMEMGLQQGGGMDPKFVPALKAYLGQFIAVAEQFVTDADSATFGINLAKEGVSTTLMAEFGKDTYVGKIVAGLKNTDQSLTAGLPAGKYFVYGGIGHSPNVDQLLNDFLAPIEKEIAKLGADGKALGDYIAAVKEYMAAAKSITGGMIAPPGAAIGNQQGAIQMVTIVNGDSGKIMEAQQKMFAVQGDFMKMSGMGNVVKMAVTPAAKTVEGVKLDHISMTYGQANTVQEQQALFMMKMMYGPNGLNGYTGALDANRVVSVMGAPEEVLIATIKAAKAGEDPLGKGPAAKVAPGLPGNRIAVVYVPLDQIFTTVTEAMAAQGMPAGVKLPPNLPPMGVAVSTEGTAFKIDSYVPSPLIESMISAGLQLYLKQMGGGGAQPGL